MLLLQTFFEHWRVNCSDWQCVQLINWPWLLDNGLGWTLPWTSQSKIIFPLLLKHFQMNANSMNSLLNGLCVLISWETFNSLEILNLSSPVSLRKSEIACCSEDPNKIIFKWSTILGSSLYLLRWILLNDLSQ